MKEQDLAGRARRIEEIVRERFDALQAELGEGGIIGELRGRGAMLALEFVLPGGKAPNAEATKAIAAQCLREGVIILTCGTYGNVVRLLPPLVITEELLADGLGVLEHAIRTVNAA